MADYDHIARNWHEATGPQGGSFKRNVLNNVLLKKIATVSGKTILELGAGNGYFMRLALQHYSGENPKRVVISDISTKLLAIARSTFYIAGAEYLELDIRSPYPLEDQSFDLILAAMIFNEVSNGGVKRALSECYRIMQQEGLLLITVTHPEFVASLAQRDLLKRNRDGILTMPESNQMRLPIVPRKLKNYISIV